MRLNALIMLSPSQTAMHIGLPISVAFFSAAAMMRCLDTDAEFYEGLFCHRRRVPPEEGQEADDFRERRNDVAMPQCQADQAE